MNLQEYVFDEEEILKSAQVYESEHSISDDQKGTLACTPKRIVYISGNTATDISLHAVHAIEYSAPSFPTGYILVGVLLGLTGLAAGEINSSIASLAMSLLIIAGVGVVAAGFLLRRHLLKIHIPGQSFEFASTDNLEDMAHMIRGQEAKKK